MVQSIGNLQDLTYFDASCNRIEFLPEEMEGLRNVADLHLNRNYLQELPKNIGEVFYLSLYFVLECPRYTMH